MQRSHGEPLDWLALVSYSLSSSYGDLAQDICLPLCLCGKSLFPYIVHRIDFPLNKNFLYEKKERGCWARNREVGSKKLHLPLKRKTDRMGILGLKGWTFSSESQAVLSVFSIRNKSLLYMSFGKFSSTFRDFWTLFWLLFCPIITVPWRNIYSNDLSTGNKLGNKWWSFEQSLPELYLWGIGQLGNLANASDLIHHPPGLYWTGWPAPLPFLAGTSSYLC